MVTPCDPEPGGATATLQFTGSSVAWFATRAPSRGRAKVYLDGVLVRTVDLHRSRRAARRMVFRHAWPASGPHTLTIRVVGTPGHPAVDIDGFVILAPPSGDPVLVGAGDISYCSTTGDSRTAALLDRIGGRVFVAGDLAYPSGTTAQFRDCYGPTWGRWKLRTSPVPGNHEYQTDGGGARTLPTSGREPARPARAGTRTTWGRGGSTASTRTATRSAAASAPNSLPG